MNQCSFERNQAFLKAVGENGTLEEIRSMLEGQPESVVAELLQCKHTNKHKLYYGCTALHTAAMEEMKDVVEYLIQRGANPNLLDPRGHTVLGRTLYDMAETHQCQCDSVFCDSMLCTPRCTNLSAIANCLLEHPKLDINLCDVDGRCCLSYALQCGNMHLVQKLIQCGANATAVDVNGKSALHHVVDLIDLCKNREEEDHEQQRNTVLTTLNCILCHSDLDVNSPNADDGFTPLYFALAWPQAARLLIQHGASVLDIDRKGCSALHQSMYLINHYNNPITFIDEILAHKQIDIKVVDKERNTPLHYLFSDQGWRSASLVEVLDHLIQKGLKTDLVNADQNTALHLLCQEHMCDGDDDEHCQAICVLLQHMAAQSVNARNVKGFTPLHLAIDNGNKRCAMKLLEHNSVVDVNARSRVESWTPLHLACRKYYPSPHCPHWPLLIQMLMEQGADLNAQDSEGNTPLHVCAEHRPEIATLLLKQEGIHLNVGNRRGLIPLHVAALSPSQGSLKCAMLLLDCQGIVVDAKATHLFARTPLHIACSASNTQLNLIEKLIAKGADIHARDSNGNTPLHLACCHGRWESTEYLLTQDGINLGARNKQGFTPLMMAAQWSAPLNLLFQFIMHTGGTAVFLDAGNKKVGYDYDGKDNNENKNKKRRRTGSDSDEN